jgi:uncharacterized protein YndB with AHSA1/START domain
MTVRIRVGTTIDAPPERVWQVVESIEHHTDWMADAQRITFVSARRRGVGTEFDCLTRVGPFRTTDRMTVTEWEPGRSMGIEHRGVVTGRGRFTLKRRRHGRTRFSWSERLRFPWWMGGPVGERLAKPLLRAIWRRNLTRLRRIAENGIDT